MVLAYCQRLPSDPQTPCELANTECDPASSCVGITDTPVHLPVTGFHLMPLFEQMTCLSRSQTPRTPPHPTPGTSAHVEQTFRFSNKTLTPSCPRHSAERTRSRRQREGDMPRKQHPRPAQPTALGKRASSCGVTTETLALGSLPALCTGRMLSSEKQAAGQKQGPTSRQ